MPEPGNRLGARQRGTALDSNPQLVEVGRMMLISCGGSPGEASKRLLTEHNLRVPRQTLERWRDMDVVRYEELRREMAPKMESELAEDMLANAHLATVAERTAIENAHRLLLNNEVSEPARMARDLSQVRTQAVDKRLALQGRPTQVTEKRDVAEILRALEGMGVAQRVDIEATAEEE